jgi:hypothetical protein
MMVDNLDPLGIPLVQHKADAPLVPAFAGTDAVRQANE